MPCVSTSFATETVPLPCGVPGPAPALLAVRPRLVKAGHRRSDYQRKCVSAPTPLPLPLLPPPPLLPALRSTVCLSLPLVVFLPLAPSRNRHHKTVVLEAVLALYIIGYGQCQANSAAFLRPLRHRDKAGGPISSSLSTAKQPSGPVGLAAHCIAVNPLTAPLVSPPSAIFGCCAQPRRRSM